MTNDEKLYFLAKVLVRQGERINLAAEQWNEEDPKDGSETSARIQGRIEAAKAFSDGLRADIDATLSVNEVYDLIRDEPPEPSAEGVDEIERLRRKLRVEKSRAEMFQVQLQAYERAMSHARQAIEDPGPHEA